MKKIYFTLLLMSFVCNFQISATESGDLLYRNNCAKCHGADGSGTALLGQIMGLNKVNFRLVDTAIQLAKVDLVSLVSNGRPASGMPAMKGVLTETEIEAIVLHLKTKILPSFSDVEHISQGQAIYRRHCSVCHGDKGEVAMWATGGLNPAPANFTDEKKKQELNRQRMMFSVSNGRPETAMTSWKGRFDEKQIEQVVDYIRVAIMEVGRYDRELGFDRGQGAPKSDPFMSAKDFDESRVAETAPAAMAMDQNKPAAPDPFLDNPNYVISDDPTLIEDDIFDAMLAEHDHDAHAGGDLNVALPANMQGDAIRGKQLFDDNCAACHGEKGDGKGPRAFFIFPKPRNFHHPAVINRFTRPHIFTQISKGIIGTVMPAWQDVLDRQQIADITEYLFVEIIHQGQPETN